MILSRTPFRISFAGGGSDFSACYERQGGAVLATAIDKYMYIAVKKHFGPDFRISYSRTEFAESVDAVEHPIVRECLQEVGAPEPLEIVSMGDLPAQAGMGSSSSFTVGLLHALHVHRGAPVVVERLAEQACRIEIERLGEPIGKQDQYIAAYGGLCLLRFERDGSVRVEPVCCPRETVRKLDRRLLIFFSGMTRNARDILADQQRSAGDNLDVLAEMSDIARRMRDILTSGGDIDDIGVLLHEAWEAKKTLEPSITSHELDEMYDRGCKAGAVGGKVLGAGGGGFLMFYCRPELQDALRTELADLTETPFSMVSDGTRIVYPEERLS